MRVCTLQLEQFRSYPALQLDFSETAVHVLVGPNGIGKTNILESIALLSLTKSFLGADPQEMMHWGSQHYRVQATVQNDAGEESELTVASQVSPRRKSVYTRNGVSTTARGMVGALPTVVFLPQDLDLFTGTPQRRRQFLDQLLCQVSPEYLQELSYYQNVLKQRNRLLRQISEGAASAGDLVPWNLQLAQHGAYVTIKRLELIQTLQCTLGEEMVALGESWDDPHILYMRKTESNTVEDLQGEFAQRLQAAEERDIILRSTSVGPHREDWEFSVDDRSIATFASRGQQRTAVLALLFLQVSFLELHREEKPVVLLDDVFSELDAAHQDALLQSLGNHQVLLSTVHCPSTLHGAQEWHVQELRTPLEPERQQHHPVAAAPAD